jgi:uncharacterized protein (TIGR02266 family)
MDERHFGGQRRGSRVVVNREFDSAASFVREYVSNISSNGAFIVTSDPLPIGTKVHLKFTVIENGIQLVEGEGEVVRHVKAGHGHKAGMGVVFTKLDSCSEELIRSMVTRAPKKKPVILG